MYIFESYKNFLNIRSPMLHRNNFKQKQSSPARSKPCPVKPSAVPSLRIPPVTPSPTPHR